VPQACLCGAEVAGAPVEDDDTLIPVMVSAYTASGANCCEVRWTLMSTRSLRRMEAAGTGGERGTLPHTYHEVEWGLLGKMVQHSSLADGFGDVPDGATVTCPGQRHARQVQ
jgi:hypothetical protein